MRHTLPIVLVLLLAAAGLVYALILVANDLRHVSDQMEAMAHDLGAMAEDVRSIADDVNAIADALAGDEDDDTPQQSTGTSRHARLPRVRRARLAARASVRVGIGGGAR